MLVHALEGGIFGAVGQDLIGGLAGRLEDGFAVKLQLGAAFDQPLQNRGVEGVVAAEHQPVGLVAGGGEHGLVFAGQAAPGLEVDQGGEGGARLPPARVVVVAGCFVQAELLVVVGAGPFGGVDGAPIQRQEDLTAREHLHVHPQGGHHLAAQAWDAHLQALQGGHPLQGPLEPAAHLGASVARREAAHAEIAVEPIDGFQTAAFVEPSVLLLGRETEGHGGAEGQGGVFAEVVVAGRVAALHRAVLHRFQHLQAGHEFTGGEGLDEKATSAHLAHPAADRFRPAKDRVQGVGPAGGHPPAHQGEG